MHCFSTGHIGPLLGCAHQMSRQYMDRQLREYDMTPVQTHALLYLIHETPDREVNQRDLEEFLHVRPSTVNGIVERLEQKELLTRTPSRTDGRRRSLTLTERGRSFEAAFCAITEAAEAHLLSGFSPEEAETLRQLLVRLIEHLRQEENESC